MIVHISRKLTELLQKNHIVEDDEAEIIMYGLEILVYNSALAILFLLIGFLLRMAGLTAVHLIIFCGLRSFTGGYHAKSYLKCFILSVCTYVSIMLVCFCVPILEDILVITICDREGDFYELYAQAE